jgi:RsiW-degrading membrane proteinase PrsW (M82 family)
MRSVVQTQWERWSQSVAVPLALFAAAVWYLILVSSASRERFRWLRYLSPVFAGVLSVWLLEWLQSYIGYNPSYKGGDKSGVQELIYTILYVGVPEEGVKLAFFALFVPILLRYDSRVKAALTAGCVGLGFAMDENMLYFDNEGVAVAVGRLMTANFMHIALTGLTGLWFYRMIRSRFHQAGEFVVMFVGMAVAHGVYDFATTIAAMEWGVDFAGILILFGLAKLYLHELRPRDASSHRALVSSTSILFLGLSLVMAVAIVVAVWQTNEFAVVADVLKETLGIIPVTVLFVREFREV